MSKLKNLNKQQLELLLGDLLDQLGHDLRITIEYEDDLGMQAISMSGAKFENK